MTRRILVLLPVLLTFTVVGIVFLAAHAPRTWAAHWTQPTRTASEDGASEFGAVPASHGAWDLLWVNVETSQLIHSHATGSGAGTSEQIDRGQVEQPTLVRIKRQLFGAWVHNFNGSTELDAAILQPAADRRIVRIAGGRAPIEHPYLFAAPNGAVGLVFSWQQRGNFDLYMTTLTPGLRRIGAIHRLTTSEFYSFYPRAVTDAAGGIDIMHLESCCQQQGWNVVFQRFDSAGHALSPVRLLDAIRFNGFAPDVNQWGADLRATSNGTVWGAFGGLNGALIFAADSHGHIVRKPVTVDSQGASPESIAIAASNAGGYVFWEQPYDLGSYLESRSFDPRLRFGTPERVEYLSGHQTNPHAALIDGTPTVVWQSWNETNNAVFDISGHRAAQGPDLAQRLGFGLGNPWEDAVVLSIGSMILAVLATVINLLAVVVLALIGLLVVRWTQKVPGRWLIYSCFLTAVIYAVFVTPGGGPTLFLTPIPTLGLAAVPFGLLAVLGSMFFVIWMGQTALKRIDDIYRAAIMAFLGIYFIAFLEAAVFIQQRLGYI